LGRICLISLIVLVAGKSTRFGENKLLYRIGERTMVERVVVNAVGSEAERVRRELSGAKCKFVYNRRLKRDRVPP